LHSYHLLIAALGETGSSLPTGSFQTILQNATALPEHGHIHVVDPNAAWFAAVSVLVKEWLYRVTKNVADAERSPVLLANAIHHRSDAYSSIVALLAILSTWLLPALPLDPAGGQQRPYLWFQSWR
jgi:divalent metal cation (Fe/Co/Zn/Cd) transporter